MKNQLQGIALVLFGILLNIFGVGAMMYRIFPSDYNSLPCFLGVIVGVAGLIYVFKKNDAR